MSLTRGAHPGLTPALLAVLATVSCGPRGVPAAPTAMPRRPSLTAGAPTRAALDHREPRWEDALLPHAPIRLGLRPKMLQEDRVYGPLWRHALGVARARSRVVAGTRLLEAIEHADEVHVELDAVPRAGQDAPSPADERHPGEAAGEMVVVVRGVPGDVDPASLVDPDGHPLWSAGPFGPVRELVHEQDPDGSANPASLFELPGRTWVIAAGPSRARARDAFARPLGRPVPVFAPEALALVDLDGPELVGRVHALGPGGGLAALGRGLDSVTFELRPAVEHEVRATFKYEAEENAAAAEHTLGDLKGAIERTKPAWLMWFDAANVVRTVARTAGDEGDERADVPSGAGPNGAKATKTVLRIDAPLPAELLDAWLEAGQPAKLPQ